LAIFRVDASITPAIAWQSAIAETRDKQYIDPLQKPDFDVRD